MDNNLEKIIKIISIMFSIVIISYVFFYKAKEEYNKFHPVLKSIKEDEQITEIISEEDDIESIIEKIIEMDGN